MSYDLYLSPGAGSRAQLESWLDENPLVERQGEDDFFYENGATFTSCSLRLEDARLVVEVSYLRPFSFAEEIALFLGDLCARGGYEVEEDPRVDGHPSGPYARACFLRAWLAGNVFAYASSLQHRLDEDPYAVFPPHVEYADLDAIWSWNLDESLANHDGGIRVATLQLAESDDAVFTLGLVHAGGERVLVPTADTYAVFNGDEPVRFVEDEAVTDLLDTLPTGPDFSVVMTPDTMAALWARGERKGISTLHPHEVWETELVEQAFEALRVLHPEREAELAALREHATLEPASTKGAIRTQVDLIRAVLAGAHRDAVHHFTPTWLVLRSASAGDLTLLSMRTPDGLVVSLTHSSTTQEKRTERAALETLDPGTLDAWIARMKRVL